MSVITKYLRYLTILEQNNKKLDLNAIDIELLNHIAKAQDKGQTLYVKDLLPLNEIASQATIHGRLKKLVAKKLISLKENKIDGRLKEVMLTKLAYKRFELLSNAMN